jgi:hypothetical protein
MTQAVRAGQQVAEFEARAPRLVLREIFAQEAEARHSATADYKAR